MTAGRGSHFRLKSVGLGVTGLAVAFGGLILLTSDRAAGEIGTYVEGWAPLHLLAWVWFAVAGVCFAGIWLRGLRPAAFSTAAALNVLWGFSHLATWAAAGAESDTWVESVVYLVIAALVLVVAGIREGADGWEATGPR